MSHWLDFAARTGRRCGRIPLEAYELVEDQGDADDLPENWPVFEGPLDSIPQTRAEVYAIFGDPGVGKVSPKWERANLVVARELSAIPKGRLYVHRLAEPYLREALRRTELVAPGHIETIGSFAFRHQRHDAARPLSYHSWAIAVDINPGANLTWTRDPKYDPGRRRGPVPSPFADDWRSRYWPGGLLEELVDAWESVGWRWGGRWASFVDPMHFELVTG